LANQHVVNYDAVGNLLQNFRSIGASFVANDPRHFFFLFGVFDHP
jgi:hypothetical protein